jgi:hypothetical protein
MFKMQMGMSGVGTPNATYAVPCYQAEGTKLNQNHEQPWASSRRRPLNPESWREVSLNNTCYRYTVQLRDSVASIVDHFGLDMRKVSNVGCHIRDMLIARESPLYGIA